MHQPEGPPDEKIMPNKDWLANNSCAITLLLNRMGEKISSGVMLGKTTKDV